MTCSSSPRRSCLCRDSFPSKMNVLFLRDRTKITDSSYFSLSFARMNAVASVERVRLGVCNFTFLGTESMFPRRTQTLTWLLIFWQLLLLWGAPWLHPFVDGTCSASFAEQPSTTTRCHRNHSHGSPSPVAANCSGSNKSCGDQLPSDPVSHDCSNCAICQAISAPRVLVVLIELTQLVEQTGVVETPHCADPLLGFCLPRQCRAPPVA